MIRGEGHVLENSSYNSAGEESKQLIYHRISQRTEPEPHTDREEKIQPFFPL